MKKIETTLNITHETFTDEKGLLKPYVAFKFEFEGETFSVSIKDSDKKLLNYLLKKNGFFENEAQ